MKPKSAVAAPAPVRPLALRWVRPTVVAAVAVALLLVSSPGRAADLVVDDTMGNTPSPYTFPGGTAVYGIVRAGNSNNGTINQSSGTLTSNTAFGLGIGPNAVGIYNLSGGTLQVLGACVVGEEGTGNLAITGGTFDASQNTNTIVNIGGSAGGKGTVTLSGSGTFNAYDEIIGYQGTATFTQTGGTHTISDNLNIGQLFGSQGTYNLSGGTLDTGSTPFTTSIGFSAGTTGFFNLSGTGILKTNSMSVGYEGAGTFTQTGGTHTVNSFLDVGENSGGQGTYNLSGGTLDTSSATSPTTIGNAAGSMGRFNLSGNGILRSSAVNLGYQGTGIFTQGGGTHTISNVITMGFLSGASGTYNLSGGILAVSGETIGNSGTGIFNQTGGRHTVNGYLNVGDASGGRGTYTLSGGTLDARNSAFPTTVGNSAGSTGNFNLSGTGTVMVNYENVGYSGTGTVTQNAGTHAVGNGLELGSQATGNGTYNLNGGMLQASVIQGGAGTSTFNFDGGTLQVNAAAASFFGGIDAVNVRNGGAKIDTDGFAATVAVTLRHSAINGDAAIDGGLTKLGAGTLTLSGANTYTGGTFINAGTLALGSAGAIPASGNIDFGGGTLQFSGANTTDYSARIKNSAAPISIDTNGQSVTFAGALDGTNTGGLTKLGAGTLTFSTSTANTYTGNTQVIGGTLVLAKGSAGPANNFGAAMGGNLVIESGATALYGASSQVRDDKSITVNSGGTLDVNGYQESITNLTMNGGAVTTDGNSANGGGSNGYLNVRGTVSADSTSSSYSGNLHLEAPAAGGMGTVSVASGGAFRIFGVISNGDNGLATRLNKTGDGTLILSNANTYSGGTIVSGGNLLTINRSGSATGTGSVSVNSSGILSGNGFIAGDVTVNSGGTISPGSSPGRLTVNNNVTFMAGSTLSIELSGTTATTQYDQLFLSGQLTLAGGLTVSLLNGFIPTIGSSFAIVDNTGTTLTLGAFANAPGGFYTDSTGVYAIDYAANVDGGTLPNDVTLTYLGVNPIPEPATWVMTGAGMLALLGAQRVRSRNLQRRA